MGAAQLNTFLDNTVDRHFGRPAVACGEQETDFERFDESVQWLGEDLASRGISARQRVGVCVGGGWEFLLAFHALVRLNAVVVPVDLYDETSVTAAAGLDLHFVLTHCAEDFLLEENVGLMCGDRIPPTFDVAEEFRLIAISPRSPLQAEGGLILNDLGFRFWGNGEVAERIGGLQTDLDLDEDARAVVCGPWSCPSAVMLVLACAASGSCVHVVDHVHDSVTVHDALGEGDVSVVFAPPLVMHDLMRAADPWTWGPRRPRMVLPDGEVLPEVLLRRRGLTRQTCDDPPVYRFGLADRRPVVHAGYGRRSAELRPVS